MIGGSLHVPGNQLVETSFFIELPEKNIKFSYIPVYLEIFSDNHLLEEIRTSFIGPETKK